MTSSTIDHHELFLLDGSGRERSFELTNFDFPCGEGHTLTIVWATAEGAAEGPPIQVRNHTTDERHSIAPERITHLFAKPSFIWGVSAASFVAIALVLDAVLGVIAGAGLYFYLTHRAKKRARALMSSVELRQLEAEVSKIQPVAA